MRPGLLAAAAIILILGTSGDVPADLATLGAEFTVNDDLIPVQNNADIAPMPGGGYVVVWDHDIINQPDTDPKVEVRMRIYDADSTPLTGEIAVNADPLEIQMLPAVATDAAGNITVVWQSGDSPVAGNIFGRRFDATGAPLTGDFRISDATTDDKRRPNVAVAPGGATAVVWEDGDGPGIHVYAATIDTDGSTIVAPFDVAPDPSHSEFAPDIAIQADGTFALSWRTFRDPDPVAIYAAAFNGSGASVGAEQLVGGDAIDLQSQIVADDIGGFVVVRHQDGIFVTRYDSGFAPLGSEIPVAAEFSKMTSAAWTSDGEILLTGIDPASAGVIAMRVDPAGNVIDRAIVTNTAFAGSTVDDPSAVEIANGRYAAAYDTTASVARDVKVQILCDDPNGDGVCDDCTGTGDSDADGLDDECDPCTNVAGAVSMNIKPKLQLSRIEADGKPWDESLSFKGEFDLAPGSTFADMDLVAEGVNYALYDQAGTALWSRRIAGGDGWSSRANGRVWAYKAPVTNSLGMRKIRITDRDKRSPGRVRVSIKAKKTLLAPLPGDEPIQLQLTLGGQSAAMAGLCTETVYTPAECRFSSNGSKLFCEP